MITLLPTASDDLIALQIDGRIDDNAYEAVIEAIEERLDRHETLRVYVEVEDLGRISIETVLKDIRFGLKHWDRFSKMAIVTDTRWLKTITDPVDSLFPPIDLRAFPLEEREAARTWLDT